MHNIPRSRGDSENMWERFYSVNRGHVIQTQQIGRENLDTASTFLYTKPDGQIRYSSATYTNEVITKSHVQIRYSLATYTVSLINCSTNLHYRSTFLAIELQCAQ